MDAYILVQTEPGLATTVMNALVESEIVDRALAITGSHDVFARVNNIEWDDLKDRLLNKLQRVPGVVRSETSIVVPLDAVALKLPPLSHPVFFELRGGLDALVFVKIAAGTGTEVVRALADSGEVMGMAVTTGDYDVIVQVRARSIQRLAKTVLKEIQAIPGVVDTTTSLILASTPLKERGPARRKRPAARRKPAARKPARRKSASRGRSRR